MYGNRFYHETMRKYTAFFGTLFNDIVIERKDGDSKKIQKMKVPIAYGPSQKFLAKISQDEQLDSPAIQLPRMSFEIVGMAYAPDRRVGRNNTCIEKKGKESIYVAGQAPYNIEMQLNVMVKYSEDGFKIIEQILPFFQPETTHGLEMIEGSGEYVETSVVLNAVTNEDSFESSFEERRVLIWTLNFTLKGFMIGPARPKKLIKFTKTNVYDSFSAEDYVESIIVKPGLTEDGLATNISGNSIAHTEIEGDDDWGYIVEIKDE